jgi:hypothetical protein
LSLSSRETSLNCPCCYTGHKAVLSKAEALTQAGSGPSYLCPPLPGTAGYGLSLLTTGAGDYVDRTNNWGLVRTLQSQGLSK